MTHDVTLPKAELGLIAATCAMLGVGIGLLVSEHLTDDHRKILGWSLLLAGVVSTVPLAADVLTHRVH